MNLSGGLEAAAGVHVGQDHDLVRRQDLGGIGHELDAAERDDVGIGFSGLARKLEAVAHEIGNVLNFRALVIVPEDHRVALLAQTVDLGAQVEAGKVQGLGSHRVTSSRPLGRAGERRT